MVCCSRVEPSHCIKFRGVSMDIDHWLATVADTPFTQEGNPGSDLVEQAERLALANLDEPLHIALVIGTLLVVAGGTLLVRERGRPAGFPDGLEHDGQQRESPSR